MLKVDINKHIARVTLDRPDVLNAFDSKYAELLSTLK